MRPADTTADEIIAAGQALLEAGKGVTGFGLRQLLGGGNAQRLKSIWDEYESSQVETVPAIVSLPVELDELVSGSAAKLAESFRAMAVAVYGQAKKDADKRVSELVAAAQEKALKAEGELVTASAVADEQDAKLEAQELKIQELKDSQEKAGRELAQFEIKQAKSDEREENQQAQIQRLEAQLQEAAHRVEELHREREQASAEGLQIRAELVQMTQDLAHARAAAENAQTSFEKAKAHHVEELARVTKTSAEQRAEFDSVRMELASKDGQLKNLGDVYKQLVSVIGPHPETGKDTSKETIETVKGTKPRGKKAAPVQPAE